MKKNAYCPSLPNSFEVATIDQDKGKFKMNLVDFSLHNFGEIYITLFVFYMVQKEASNLQGLEFHQMINNKPFTCT